MKPTNTLKLIVAFVLLPSMLSAQSSAKKPLEGAWKVVEIVDIGADTSKVSNPQPSLIIFGQRHYSVMWIPGNQARALWKGENPTNEEKISAFESFVANAGTYEVAGTTLTLYPIVARNPNFMSGGFVKYQYRVEGTTLWLTSRTADFSFRIGNRVVPSSGPQGENRLKLVRME